MEYYFFKIGGRIMGLFDKFKPQAQINQPDNPAPSEIFKAFASKHGINIISESYEDGRAKFTFVLDVYTCVVEIRKCYLDICKDMYGEEPAVGGYVKIDTYLYEYDPDDLDDETEYNAIRVCNEFNKMATNVGGSAVFSDGLLDLTVTFDFTEDSARHIIVEALSVAKYLAHEFSAGGYRLLL